MFNRRKLFGFAAAAPVAALLPANQTKAKKIKEDISSFAPVNGPIIQIQAQEIKSMHNSSPYIISASFPTPVGSPVGISVGKDGHMWVKINGQWKRVVVE